MILKPWNELSKRSRIAENDPYGNRDGSCRIFNPSSDYKRVVLHQNYQAAQEWLLADEYERVKDFF
jgi:hypothetical protein